MPFIDYDYYKNSFGGADIPTEEFDSISEAAEDVVRILCTKSDISGEDECIRRATAYQTELIYLQGGRAALVGLQSSAPGKSERMGDYSISYDSSVNGVGISVMGVPVSAMAYSILKKAGYTCRAAYRCNGGAYAG